MKKHLISVCYCILLTIATGNTQIIKPFTKDFQVTQRGGIVFLANVAVGCSSNPTTAGGACEAGTAEMPPGGSYGDNYYFPVYIDIDNDPTTFMSSSDSLNLPPCSEITWAGLYWGANGYNVSGRTTIKIKVNNGSYQSITADSSISIPIIEGYNDYNTYHCFKDITGIVKTGGPQARFTLANIPFSNQLDVFDMFGDYIETAIYPDNIFGSWMIAVVYKNDTMRQKQLTVFDGLADVGDNIHSLDLPISGFYTPVSGPVNIDLGVYVHDGDRNLVGDEMAFNGADSFVYISDALHPDTNIMNSTVSYEGVLTPFRVPNLNNTCGLDANIFAPDNSLKQYIGNGDSSAILRLQSVGANTDIYLTQTITTAIDVYEPDLRITKKIRDKYGNDIYNGVVQPGDTLEYIVTVKNIGADTSFNTYVYDTIGNNITYLPGSLKITEGANAGSLTDASGDDQGEYSSSNKIITVRIGTGANAISGGIVNTSSTGNDSIEIRYKVVASSDCLSIQCNNSIKNMSYVWGIGQLSNDTLLVGSNPGLTNSNGCAITTPSYTINTINNTNCVLPPDTTIYKACTSNSLTNLYPLAGYTYYDSSYTEVSFPFFSGSYYAIKTAGTGCSDTVVIKIDSVVNCAIVIRDTIIGCSSVIYNSKTYTASTTIIDTIHTSFGFDSVYHIETIYVYPNPLITVSNDTTICYGQSATLYASSSSNVSDSVVLQWVGYAGQDSITVSPSSNTKYKVVATNKYECSDSATTNVIVDQFNLTVTANPNNVVSGTKVYLQTNSSDSYYITSWWPFNYFTSQTAYNQDIVTSDSSIQIRVIGESQIGCIDTAWVDIISRAPYSKDLYVPNAFTPNGDGVNDLFKVYGTGIKELLLMIFNQWGEKIYESKDLSSGWDGYYKGKLQPIGVYVYVLKVTFLDDTNAVKTGSVNLIR